MAPISAALRESWVEAGIKERIYWVWMANDLIWGYISISLVVIFFIYSCEIEIWLLSRCWKMLADINGNLKVWMNYGRTFFYWKLWEFLQNNLISSKSCKFLSIFCTDSPLHSPNNFLTSFKMFLKKTFRFTLTTTT